MAREDIKIYRRKHLKALAALRDVGMETKFHIYDTLDPFRNRDRKSQVIASAVVSKEEILNGNLAALKAFTDNLHTISNPSQIASRVVHHGRVAVVMNASEKCFFEHGECRLFDPYRKHLFKIIDEEVLSHTGRKKKRKITKSYDTSTHGVFENMENNYLKTFHTFADAVILLYSFYIPCSIDFHNCAKLLHAFVNESGHEMVIGFEHVHHLTDEHVSLKWLDLQNITVFNGYEMNHEIRDRASADIKRRAEDNLMELSCMYDHFNEKVADISDDFEDFKVPGRLRLLRRELCREIMKEYNSLIR